MKEEVGGGRLNFCRTSVRAAQRALTRLSRIWGPQNIIGGFFQESSIMLSVFSRPFFLVPRLLMNGLPMSPGGNCSINRVLRDDNQPIVCLRSSVKAARSTKYCRTRKLIIVVQTQLTSKCEGSCSCQAMVLTRATHHETMTKSFIYDPTPLYPHPEVICHGLVSRRLQNLTRDPIFGFIEYLRIW